MTDTYEHKHGQECGDTSNHKSHKIDYIGVSDNLLPAIISCGFLPWNDIMFSDHRVGFLKWDRKLLFGDILDDATVPTSRKLLLCYPERVEKYRTYVEERFREQKLFQALDKLIYRVNKKGSWTKKMKRKYNNIDKIVTEIMLEGENQCVPTFKNKTAWGTELLKCSNILHYWSMNISQLKGRKVATTVLLRVLEQTEIEDNSTTLKDAELRRKEARKDLKISIIKAKDRRLAEIQDRAEVHAAEGNHSAEAALKEIINSEKSKVTRKVIRRALEDTPFSSLDKLVIPGLETIDEAGKKTRTPDKILTKKENIHNAICDHNE